MPGSANESTRADLLARVASGTDISTSASSASGALADAVSQSGPHTVPPPATHPRARDHARDHRGLATWQRRLRPSAPTKRAGGLFLAYLAASIGIWWHVWSNHPTSTYLCACGDPGQYLWFFWAPAQALLHGHLPFFTGAAYHPGGVNLLDNPGVLGLAIISAPITWLFGPVASVNTVLTLTPACSALTAYVLLCRWVRWWPAAAFGGLFYGFSPLVVASLQYVHLQVAFLALPPLIVLCLDDLLVRQQRPPVRVGAALAVLVAAQYLVSPEMLVITALGAVIGVVLLGAFTAWKRPDVLRQHLPGALRGAGVAVGGGTLLLAYPLWFALAGPRHTVGAPWTFIARTGNALSEFFVVGAAAYHRAPSPVLFGYSGQPGPGTGFLGVTVVGSLVVTVVAMRRDGLVRLAAVLGIILVALSLGTVLAATSPAVLSIAPRHRGTDWWLPWSWLAHVPLVNETSPSRISAAIDLLVALIGAVGLDQLVTVVSARRPPGASRTPPLADRADNRAAGLVGVAMAAAVLAPVGLAYRLPLVTHSVATPRWYSTVAPRLPAGSVVLALPWGFSQTSAWQAVTGAPAVMAGGDAFVPGPGGHVVDTPKPTSAEGILTDLSIFGHPPAATPAAIRTIRQAITRWGVTTVVIAAVTAPPTAAVVFMTATLGRPPVHGAGVWAWYDVSRAPPPLAVPPAEVERCQTPTARPTSAARCVYAMAAAGARRINR